LRASPDPACPQTAEKLGIEVAYGSAENSTAGAGGGWAFKALVKDFGLTPK
jgi:hypothetical protein